MFTLLNIRIFFSVLIFKASKELLENPILNEDFGVLEKLRMRRIWVSPLIVIHAHTFNIKTNLLGEWKDLCFLSFPRTRNTNKGYGDTLTCPLKFK
jgi:hypothetical protein